MLCLPEQITLYLVSLSKVSVLLDEFVLTHRKVFADLSARKELSLHFLTASKSVHSCMFICLWFLS